MRHRDRENRSIFHLLAILRGENRESEREAISKNRVFDSKCIKPHIERSH